MNEDASGIVYGIGEAIMKELLEYINYISKEGNTVTCFTESADYLCNKYSGCKGCPLSRSTSEVIKQQAKQVLDSKLIETINLLTGDSS